MWKVCRPMFLSQCIQVTKDHCNGRNSGAAGAYWETCWWGALCSAMRDFHNCRLFFATSVLKKSAGLTRRGLTGENVQPKPRGDVLSYMKSIKKNPCSCLLLSFKFTFRDVPLWLEHSFFDICVISSDQLNTPFARNAALLSWGTGEQKATLHNCGKPLARALRAHVQHHVGGNTSTWHWEHSARQVSDITWYLEWQRKSPHRFQKIIKGNIVHFFLHLVPNKLVSFLQHSNYAISAQIMQYFKRSSSSSSCSHFLANVFDVNQIWLLLVWLQLNSV